MMFMAMLDPTHPFANEVGGWIMQESFKNCHQCILILAQETEGDFAGSTERSYAGKLTSNYYWASSSHSHHYIRKHRKHRPCCASTEMEPLRASRMFDPSFLSICVVYINLLAFLTLSKRQLKSTCKIPPVPSSNARFSPCRSPNLSDMYGSASQLHTWYKLSLI